MSTWEQTTGRAPERRIRTAPLPNGIAAGVGFVGAVVATTIAVAVGSTHDVWLALVPLGLVTAAVSATTGWVGGIATAWICWSLDSGFVLGREAQLDFSRAAQLSALVLIVVALLAGAVGRVVRRARNAQEIQSANRSPETRS